MHRPPVSLLLVTVVPVTLTGPAQAQRPAGLPVTGVVVDPTGGVLPNAPVELKNTAGVLVESTRTDNVGAFRIESVPPGRYDVRVTFDGFKPTTVRVTVGNRAPGLLRVTMPLAAITQEVTVGRGAAELTADTAANLDVATVDQQTIENLPIFNQDVLATMTRFLDAGAIGAGGRTLIVNGMEVNNLNVSASAIQQIKINQDPYSAEFARPGAAGSRSSRSRARRSITGRRISSSAIRRSMRATRLPPRDRRSSGGTSRDFSAGPSGTRTPPVSPCR